MKISEIKKLPYIKSEGDKVTGLEALLSAADNNMDINITFPPKANSAPLKAQISLALTTLKGMLSCANASQDLSSVDIHPSLEAGASESPHAEQASTPVEASQVSVDVKQASEVQNSSSSDVPQASAFQPSSVVPQDPLYVAPSEPLHSEPASTPVEASQVSVDVKQASEVQNSSSSDVPQASAFQPSSDVQASSLVEQASAPSDEGQPSTELHVESSEIVAEPTISRLTEVQSSSHVETTTSTQSSTLEFVAEEVNLEISSSSHRSEDVSSVFQDLVSEGREIHAELVATEGEFTNSKKTVAALDKKLIILDHKMVNLDIELAEAEDITSVDSAIGNTLSTEDLELFNSMLGEYDKSVQDNLSSQKNKIASIDAEKKVINYSVERANEEKALAVAQSEELLKTIQQKQSTLFGEVITEYFSAKDASQPTNAATKRHVEIKEIKAIESDIATNGYLSEMNYGLDETPVAEIDSSELVAQLDSLKENHAKYEVILSNLNGSIGARINATVKAYDKASHDIAEAERVYNEALDVAAKKMTLSKGTATHDLEEALAKLIQIRNDYETSKATEYLDEYYIAYPKAGSASTSPKPARKVSSKIQKVANPENLYQEMAKEDAHNKYSSDILKILAKIKEISKPFEEIRDSEIAAATQEFESKIAEFNKLKGEFNKAGSTAELKISYDRDTTGSSDGRSVFTEEEMSARKVAAELSKQATVHLLKDTYRKVILAEGTDVSSLSSSVDALKAKIEEANRELEAAKTAYETALAAFEPADKECTTEAAKLKLMTEGNADYSVQKSRVLALEGEVGKKSSTKGTKETEVKQAEKALEDLLAEFESATKALEDAQSNGYVGSEAHQKYVAKITEINAQRAKDNKGSHPAAELDTDGDVSVPKSFLDEIRALRKDDGKKEGIDTTQIRQGELNIKEVTVLDYIKELYTKDSESVEDYVKPSLTFTKQNDALVAARDAAVAVKEDELTTEHITNMLKILIEREVTIHEDVVDLRALLDVEVLKIVASELEEGYYSAVYKCDIDRAVDIVALGGVEALAAEGADILFG